MSDLLESRLTLQQREECARNDAAMAANEPVRRPFIVQIKEGARVVHEFGSMGGDGLSLAVELQHLCEPGQYVRCIPAQWKGESFEVKAARQELACAELREVQHTDDWHRRNDRRALELQVQHLRCIGGL